MKTSDISLLCVEDDATVRGLLCSLLKMKYPATPVYLAASADEGLEQFREHRQSIVITDINLAGSSGVQMVREIRKLDPDTVVIFISGCSDIERITAFEGSASSHHICKPMKCSDLTGLLYAYMQGHGGNRSRGDCTPDDDPLAGRYGAAK